MTEIKNKSDDLIWKETEGRKCWKGYLRDLSENSNTLQN